MGNVSIKVAPIAKVLKAWPLLVATIIELLLPVPRCPPVVAFVDVRLNAPNEILPAVSVKPVALETVTLLPKVKVADALFIVIAVRAKGEAVPRRLPVIEPEPPIINCAVAVNVAAPNTIGPFKVRLFALTETTPAVEVYVPLTVKG